jgi:ABC-type amino acid transport substrate-binding protein
MKHLIAFSLIFFLGVVPNVFAEPLRFAVTGLNPDTEGFQITVSLAKEIAKRSGVEISTIGMPAKRAQLWLSEKTIDGDWSRVDGFQNDIPGLLKISEPLAEHPYTAYSTRNDVKIDGWKSLKEYRVVYPRGWRIVEKNLLAFHKNLRASDSISSGLSIVAVRRADIYISIPFLVDEFLSENATKFKDIKALSPPLAYQAAYIFMLPKHAASAELIEAALKTMKADGTYEKILAGTIFPPTQ